MKPAYKNLLSVLGALGMILPFSGCETEAEVVEQGTATRVVTNTITSASTDTRAENSAEATGAAASADATTNTSKADAASNSSNNSETSTSASATEPTTATGTNVTNQQTVIIEKIPPALPANVNLSKPTQEIVKLAQAGLSETVLLLYVEKSTEPFDLDAEDIVYLHDIGVNSVVIAAILNHDGLSEDLLTEALSTNDVAVATAPAPGTTPTQAQQFEVSSNYVAAPQPGGTVVAQDPYAQTQQPVVVEQQPAVVYQEPVVVTEPAVTYSYFYSSLAPYGSWVHVADYGWCWQPTIAVTHRGWRPYLHGGRWFHSNAGWYWHSDYSWGWAPFHYGRWYCAPRAGWVWMPDYTWGPSWVTWRRTSDYCGWAPLPPHSRVRPGFGFSYWGRDVGFNFSFGYSHDYWSWVPARRFCDRRIIDHCVPTHRAVNIYKDSTIVNNYIVGNNNTIINNGIGRDFIASHTRNEIPRVRVADAENVGRRVQPDRLHRSGTETVVFRPSRPSANLVAAHEAAVSRTRGEMARPQSSSAVSRDNVIPGRIERPRAATGADQPESVRGRSGIVASRNETGRPPTASRDNDTPVRPVRPVFGTPAPVQPEPDRSAEIIRSRRGQESLARTGGGLITPRVGTVRPSTQGGTLAPRFQPNTVAPGNNASPRTVIPSTRSPIVDRPGTSRGEIGRGASTPNVTSPSTPSRGTVQPVRPSTSPNIRTPAASPSFRQQSEPARSPDLARPSQTVPQGRIVTPVRPSSPVTRPSTSVPATRPNPVTPAPNVSRPAPQRSTVTPSPRGPRGGEIQNRPSVSTPAQRSAPAAQPRVNPVRPGSRNESFSRPSTSVRSAAVQPRAVTPVRPQVRTSSRSFSVPTVRAPQPSVSSVPAYSSGPSSSQSVRPPPAAASAPRVINRGSAPASRPSPAAPARPSSSGRGRVEIGR